MSRSLKYEVIHVIIENSSKLKIKDMAFKMKGFPYPTNRKGKVNPKSEGNTDLADGRSASAAFQFKSALKQVEPTVEGGEEVIEGEDNTVTRGEFVDWFHQNPPEGWDGADIEEEPFEWAIDQVNEENPDMAEVEKMPLIIQLLEQGEGEQPVEETGL